MTAPEPAIPAWARTSAAPLAMLLALGVMWGLAFSFAKIATVAGAHPLGLLTWQSGGAAAIVCAACLARGRLRQLRRGHLRYFAFCGAVGIIAPSGAIYWAAPHVPAGVMAILIALATIITYALALVIRLERFHWLRATGIACGFAAVLLIVGPSASLPEPGMAGWVLVGLIAPVCYGINPLYIDRYRPAATDSQVLAFGMLVSAFAIIAPLALLSGAAYLPGPPWNRVDLAVLGLPAITGVAMLMVFELIRVAGPVYFSMVGYLVTACGVPWGMALFGERHSPWIWLALVLMFGGMALVNLRLSGAGPTAQTGRAP